MISAGLDGWFSVKPSSAESDAILIRSMRAALSAAFAQCQAGSDSEPSKRDDHEVRTEHGVIKNGRYFNTGKTYWPDGTVKFDFDRSNELDPWFNGTISNDGFINDHD